MTRREQRKLKKWQKAVVRDLHRIASTAGLAKAVACIANDRASYAHDRLDRLSVRSMSIVTETRR